MSCTVGYTDTQTNKPLFTEVPPDLFAQHNGPRYRVPVDLQLTPDRPVNFLVVGGCLAEPIPEVASIINREFRGDFVLLNNFDTFPEFSQERVSQYDFQIIHIPLRSVFGNSYFQLPDDVRSHEEFLAQTQDYLGRYLANAMKLNADHRLLTFVLGFMVPQQNPLGRLQPRYDIRNIMTFIERLNMFLDSEVTKSRNAYYVDVDQIAGGIGKKAVQDDAVWSFRHGTSLSDGDHEYDLNRLEPPLPMQCHYSARWFEFFQAMLHEIFAMHRSIRQQDMVKLVAVDLDDTLWRGVAADGTIGAMEGWPMGLMETLLYLKKRGILLAIVSKNDEQLIRAKWNDIVQGHIAFSDFAIHRINFKTKTDNLREIIRELNILPKNVVMVDDNPVERASIKAGLPEVRLLGSHPYYLKRILLWSPETQPPVITGESSRRTEMVQAQLERESVRRSLSHEEFLKSLHLHVTSSILHDTNDVSMNRALELLNKTNQFNTRGERYTLEQCQRKFEAGSSLYVLFAEDRFTQYGLIGAAWVRGNCIEHMVMSCRALGLNIEESFLAYLANEFSLESESTIEGLLQYTELNVACRQFFANNGFRNSPDHPVAWSRTLAVPFPFPAHVAFTPPSVERNTVFH